MKRKKGKKADAIFISDLHLTDTSPTSRIDNYIDAQKNKLLFLKELSYQNNRCPTICAGDIFHKWKASPWLCSFAMEHLPTPFITIPGNHDLPNHSLEMYDKSALHLLGEWGKDIFVLTNNQPVTYKNMLVTGVPFGTLPAFMKQYEEEREEERTKKKILLIHELIFPESLPSWTSGNALTAADVLNAFEDFFDIIITGDNHTSFVKKTKKSILVNPGSIMRITADKANYEPVCFLYYAAENEIKQMPLPIQKNVHSREHIDKKKEKDARIIAYIEQLKDTENWETGMSFQQNLKLFFAQNKTPKKVRETICQYLQE